MAVNGHGKDRRDTYGFSLNCSSEDEAIRTACATKQNQQIDAWEKYWKRKYLPKPEKLKKLCRKGVPVELRPWVWMQMSGAIKKKQEAMAGYYDAMLQQGEISSECARQIELDLPRTFPDNELMHSEKGQAALGRVLVAFSIHRPDIGYCQGMNAIVAMLLLVLERNEEDSFWMLVSLIDNGGILYHDMYTRHLVGTQVEMQSLEELVAQKLPSLNRHLQNLHCDMTMLATGWFLCLFATELPSESAMRVWDSLLEEGAKVLYRVSLAILKIFEAELLQLDNAGDIVSRLRACVHSLHNRDRLMKIAFNGLGSLPMRKISGFRQHQQVIVDKKMEEREQRDRARRSLSNEQVENSEGLEEFADKLGLKEASWRKSRNLPEAKQTEAVQN